MPRGSIACWEGLNIPPAVPQGFVRHSDSTNRCSCLLLLLLWTFLFWVLEDFFFSPLNCKFFSSSRIVGPDCSRLSGVELTTIDYILIFWSLQFMAWYSIPFCTFCFQTADIRQQGKSWLCRGHCTIMILLCVDCVIIVLHV